MEVQRSTEEEILRQLDAQHQIHRQVHQVHSLSNEVRYIDIDAPNDIARVVPYRPGLSGAHEAVAMSPVSAYGIR